MKGDVKVELPYTVREVVTIEESVSVVVTLTSKSY